MIQCCFVDVIIIQYSWADVRMLVGARHINRIKQCCIFDNNENDYEKLIMKNYINKLFTFPSSVITQDLLIKG